MSAGCLMGGRPTARLTEARCRNLSTMRDLPVGIIGAGRVGTAMGVAFIRAGYELVGVSARSATSRDRAARVLPDTPVLDPVTLAHDSGILLLAVSDDAIAPVATYLASNGHLRRGQYVLHASGAYGLTVLRAAADAGATPLAVHPAMTFPGLDTDADRLPGLAYAITSQPSARPRAMELVQDLAGVPVWVPDERRTLYHAALALAANNLVTLVAAAMEALATAGVDDPGLVLAPLARASLENALRLGDQALTGPVRRADTGTLDRHVDTLREHSPDLATSYIQFGLATARRAKGAGLSEADQLDRVIDLFERRASQERTDLG